ncbi:hypothetical protein [Actinoplanes sp. NPDC049265]|uniref:hypothetical protein n=1 Tax=Actinoplanes sp. NPDC049265 TaxID=3363902 RepID=UPI0037235820
MAQFAAEQIYALARQAGFTPDAAATMTAVALAESGGDSRFEGPYGRGLWPIGEAGFPEPAAAARAAFEASGGGADLSRWRSARAEPVARFLRHRAAAQAAALAYGDGENRGNWTPAATAPAPAEPGSVAGPEWWTAVTLLLERAGQVYRDRPGAERIRELAAACGDIAAEGRAPWASEALLAVDDLAWRDPGPGSAELRRAAERIRCDAHELAEAALLAAGLPPALPDPARCRRLLGQDGTSAPVRLGRPGAGSDTAVRDAAVVEHAHWSRIADDVLAGPAANRAAAVAARTCELLMASG